MVDVSEKPVTIREAIAKGAIRMSATALATIRRGAVKKGDPLQAARLAGIMAARPNEPPMAVLRRWLSALEEAIAKDDRATIKAVLKDAVPEFGAVLIRFGIDRYWDRYGWPKQCARSGAAITCA